MKGYRPLIVIPVTVAVFLASTVAYAEDTPVDDRGMKVDITVDGSAEVDISASGPVKLSVEARGPVQASINADAQVGLDVEASGEAEVTINKQQSDKRDAKPETEHEGSPAMDSGGNLSSSNSDCIGLNRYVATKPAAFPSVGLLAFSFILRFMKVSHCNKPSDRG